eukprot:316950_1
MAIANISVFCWAQSIFKKRQIEQIEIDTLLPGTWIKRPIQIGTSHTDGNESAVHLLYHHAIYLHPNIIVEYSNDNTVSFVINKSDIWTQKWRVEKEPTSVKESTNIIETIAEKYYQKDTIYHPIGNNCEHFVSSCYGTRESKQSVAARQMGKYSTVIGVLGFALSYWLFYSYVTKRTDNMKATVTSSHTSIPMQFKTNPDGTREMSLIYDFSSKIEEVRQTGIPVQNILDVMRFKDYHDNSYVEWDTYVPWQTYVMRNYFRTKRKAQIFLSCVTFATSSIIGALSGVVTYSMLTYRTCKIKQILATDRYVTDAVNTKQFDKKVVSYQQLTYFETSVLRQIDSFHYINSLF